MYFRVQVPFITIFCNKIFLLFISFIFMKINSTFISFFQNSHIFTHSQSDFTMENSLSLCYFLLVFHYYCTSANIIDPNLLNIMPPAAKKVCKSLVYKLKYNAKRSIPAHPTLFNDAQCDLHLSPVTFKINRVHPLTMVNMSAKFDE